MRVLAASLPSGRLSDRRIRPTAPRAGLNTSRVVRRLCVVLASLVWLLPAVLAWGAGPAAASPELAVSVAAPLSAVGAPLDVRLESTLGGPWPRARVRLEVMGPAVPSAGVAGLAVRGRVREQNLGDLAARLDTTVTLPAEWLADPGAYLVRATVTSGTAKVMTAELWLGKVASLPDPVDLAFVWPVASGIHRNPEGAFVDRAVQGLVVPRAETPGSLFALFSAVDEFPQWHMTLAVEPVLLAQIRDLTDGFTELDESGAPVVVEKEADTAKRALEALATFRRVAALESVQVIPGPYAMPALPLLAREEWQDGFDQMQLGKAELQSTLQLVDTLEGAYPPGLEVTTDSLQAFSRASIGYVVAGPDVARDLAEPPADLQTPVRVRDRANNRLTLVFADRELRAALAPPWDSNRFAAALAAALAAGKRGPFVAVPAGDYELPPAAFLRGVGRLLVQAPWIRTQTLAEMLSAHPPDTRPVFLSRYGGYVDSFVGQTFLDGLRAAHSDLSDLAKAAKADRDPLGALRLLLYQAESRYWFVAGLDPAVANVGLSYIEAVRKGVAAEFDKVDVARDKAVIIFGRQGDVPVAVVNKTGYPLDVELAFSGEGVDFGAGARRKVTLGLQENVFTVPAVTSRNRVTVQVQVLSGRTIVDAATVSIRSISAGAVVPWAVGVVALLAGVVVAVRRLR